MKAGFGIGLGVGLALSSGAHAADLIVRFRDPQNTRIQAATTALREGAGSASDAHLLNESEGLVQLKFNSPADAIQARGVLEKSNRVVSVAPNFLYQKAIHYRLRNVKKGARGTYLGAPLVQLVDDIAKDLIPGAMPEVELPPSNVIAGDDPMVPMDWAIQAIRLDRVPKIRATASTVTAVIDTGIDYNHEDLVGAMWRKPDNAKEVGYDFAHKNAKPFDKVQFDLAGCMKDPLCQLGIGAEKFLVNPGHGTHCAGHVAAVAGNSVGMRGVGAGAPVMALKFFYDAGEPNAGQGDDAAAIQAIDYAIKNGVKVISASWGGRQSRDEAEKSELKKALLRAQQAGVLFVVSAGNDSVDQDLVEDPSFPAAYDLDNIITVAAVDSKDALADFSSFGAKSVHIAAPGVKIFSTTSGGNYSDVVARYINPRTGKEQTMDWDGTSMATPIVAGAAALVWSKYPTENYKQIRDRILKSARTVTGLQGKVASGGVLDVAAALGP